MTAIIRMFFLFALICLHNMFVGQVFAASELKSVGDAIRVHGRLSAYNGNPSCRIWIVGDSRVLGIHEAEEECPIPPEIHKILSEDIDDRAIYADFIVTPLSDYEAGVMQIVRVESAENIVVTNRKGRFLRRVSGVITANRPSEQKR